MLRSRIVPCLLVHNGGLVKTVKFKNPKYVGDPINAVRIFNEKEVDELIVVDIDATANGREPNFQLIENLAAECRMPLCYGGGITSVQQAETIVGLGVEKVAICKAAIENPGLIASIAKAVGSQSVVVVLDVKRTMLGGYSAYVNNGKKKVRKDPFEIASECEMLGAGEVVVNSIDRDGVMCGYDMELAARMRHAIDLPMTILGGAGSVEDIVGLVETFGIVGAAAGSLFVFKGKFRAVLINYPHVSSFRKRSER